MARLALTAPQRLSLADHVEDGTGHFSFDHASVLPRFATGGLNMQGFNAANALLPERPFVSLAHLVRTVPNWLQTVRAFQTKQPEGRARMARSLAAIAASVVITALQTTTVYAETIGDKFRNVIAQIDARCKAEKRGPYLEDSDPDYRKKIADTSCDILKLKPRDWRDTKFVKLESQPFPIPEEWLATPQSRFAHSIKLPAPYNAPKVIYRSGMTRKEYFDLLCKEEAGDFVLRQVTDVVGIARQRPPEIATDDLLRHLFASEGVAAMGVWQLMSPRDDIAQVLVQPEHGRYTFVEVPAFPRFIKTDGYHFRRFERDPKNASGSAINYRADGSTYSVPNLVVEKPIDRLTARFGFTWRGITRPNDREMGIAGAELIILDFQTTDVLAFRRIFRATDVGKLGAWWLTAGNCSVELANLPTSLIYRALRPVP